MGPANRKKNGGQVRRLRKWSSEESEDLTFSDCVKIVKLEVVMAS